MKFQDTKEQDAWIAFMASALSDVKNVMNADDAYSRIANKAARLADAGLAELRRRRDE